MHLLHYIIKKLTIRELNIYVLSVLHSKISINYIKMR